MDFSFAAIDVETTGLDPTKHQVLEMGFAFYPSYQVWRVVLLHDDLTISRYCRELHKDLLSEIDAQKGKNSWNQIDEETGAELHYATPEQARLFLAQRLQDLGYSHNGKRLLVAGKNFGAFDYQFLPEMLQVYFHRRFLDPGVMYFNCGQDQYPPDLAECCRRADVANPKPHSAVSDAIATRDLVLRYYGLTENRL